VDQFILCESLVTFSGNPKPLYFDANRDRFSKFNIKYVVAGDGRVQDTGRNVGEPWQREYYQREVLLGEALRSCDSDDMVMLSDIDEIPDMDSYNGNEGVFRHYLYYYYLNCFSGDRKWRGTIINKATSIGSVNTYRDKRLIVPYVGVGWHFSTLGAVDDIIYKVESFSHQEHNTPTKKKLLSDRRGRMVDPYGRRETPYTVSTPSGPQWLLDNADRYPHLWYMPTKEGER
jgi:beta-1,4-mannosyl-glycoprotein beta-1,4-N-acetylglucosaminyltransferase